MTRKKLVFYFGVLPAFFLQLTGTYFYLIVFTGFASQVIYGITKLVILVWPAFWFFLEKGVFVPRSKMKLRKSMGWGIVSGILMSAAILAVFVLFRPFFDSFAEALKTEAIEVGLLEHYLLFSVFLSLIHSLIEEYYWRWFIFGGLKMRLSPILAGLISSAGFAVHHYIVLGTFLPWWIVVMFGTAVGVGGAVWAFIYHKTGRLSAAWISHLLVDATAMSIGWIMLT